MIRFLALAGLAIVLAACGGSAPASQPATTAVASASAAGKPASATKMTAGYSVISANQIQLWAPAEGGYFANEGLDVQVLKAGAGTIGLSALLGGDINMLITSSTSTMNAVVEGAPLVYIGSTMERIVQFMVAKKDRADLNGAQDLKGKKLGVTTPGSYSDTAGHLVAKQANLEETKDYTIIRLNDIPTIQAAVQNGAIDLGMVDSAATMAGDLKVIADLSKIDVPVSTIGFATSRSYYDQHPNEIKAFGRAYSAAVKRIRSDPEFVIKVLSKYLQIDDREKVKAIAAEALPVINDELKLDKQGLDNARQFASISLPKLQQFDVAKIMP